MWAIAIAVSAAGSMGAIMYTSCKVAQSIAAANILPWSRLWVRQHRVRSPTPAGALLLIWLFGVITLAATAAIKKLDEAISFPGAIQIYVEQSFSRKYIYLHSFPISHCIRLHEHTEGTT